MRDAGVNVDIDVTGKSPSRNMEWVKRYKIPYVIAIGDAEVAAQKVTLTDVATGNKELLTLEAVVDKIK
jgi:histidyl-tRNA synthetase